MERMVSKNGNGVDAALDQGVGEEMEVNRIYNESALDTMARMPGGFVDLTVTSPPYDNLRDYQLEKFVVWCDNISDDKKREIIAELKATGIEPVTASG